MTGENEYRADVTVGVGMIRARFDARVSLHDLNPPDSLQLRGSGSSAMGSAEAFATVTLTALEGNRTRLDYDYEATVGGRIASVGGRMLQSASKMIIGQVFSRFSRRMGGGTSRFLFLQRLWQRIRALLTGKGGPS